MVAFWKDACDEGALAWDHTNNNRAFHAGEISTAMNGASIYIFAKRNPDKIKDAAGQPMWRGISHLSVPDGPPGGAAPHKGGLSPPIMKDSKPHKAARGVLQRPPAHEEVGPGV